MGIINLNGESVESVGAYIKRGLEKDFIILAKESKDKNNFLVAQMCMFHLVQDYLSGNKEKKLTPKEAYEKALNGFPLQVVLGANETLVKTLVSQFSIRGDEFEEWVRNPKKWENLWEIEKV